MCIRDRVQSRLSLSNETSSKLLLFPTERLERWQTNMYESFYGLSHTPFSRNIPTDDLYLSLVLEETLGRLEYAAERQLFAVITGDCGTGKTTTIRRFTEMLDPSKFKICLLYTSP